MSKTASVALEGGATERRSERDSFSEAADAAARHGAHSGFRALSDAWRLTNPTGVEQGTDFAYIQLLAGDAETALKSLALGSYGAERLPPRTRALFGACVAIEPSLAVPALRVVLARGSAFDRLRAVSRIVAARVTHVSASASAVAAGA